MLRRASLGSAGGCLRALIALGPLSAGCDLLEELENDEVAEQAGSEEGGGGDGGSEGPAAGPCTIVYDDACDNQDTLASCDAASGVLTTVRCNDLCGVNPNFSCVSTAGGQHACWCVSPGKQKVWSCSELEDCLVQCAGPGACTDQCFSRTDETTIRMYGALVHCAESGCDPTCRETPQYCGGCIADSIATGHGCSLERSVCDEDRNDEDPGWP